MGYKEANTACKIKNLKVRESKANIPATPEQQKTIRECLIKKHPHFYVYIITIFHTGIRPNEILQIKLNMIDLDKQQIILLPEITKTNKERIVPINNYLLQHFENMELKVHPSDFYLFGSYRKAGKGNVGNHIDFIPAPTHVKRDTATKRWHKMSKSRIEN